MNNPFSLLIKPASADCNLNCTYCFYLDKCSLYPDNKVHRMSLETLEKLVSGYMKTDQPVYSFNWQGGEPTLMGAPFFLKAVELQQKYGKRGIRVLNSVQTNGTMIDDGLASVFKKYNFLLGVSLDGPIHIHNHYRRNRGGEGSYDDVLKGISILTKHRVDFNILTLVNNISVKKGVEVYNFLKDSGFYFHQYIPCVEFDVKGNPMPYSISGTDWGIFLCEVFDQWIKNDIYTVSIRLFDSILNLMVNGYYNLCHMAGNCCQYFVVEHNGDLYPCDFFVEPDRRLGNIADTSWDELISNQSYLQFGGHKNNWNSECSRCKYLNFCSGDCIKHRVSNKSSSNSNISYLCEGWKMFFEHTIPTFENLALNIIKQRQQSGSTVAAKNAALYPTFSIGRNDECYCGSRKKFKKCHGV